MEPYRKNTTPPRRGKSWATLATSTAIVCVLGFVPAPVSQTGGLFDLPVAQAQANCCFTARTPVLMADGSERPIAQVRPGDRVIGRAGTINRVTGIHIVPLAGRKLHGINAHAPFFTAEHPFLGDGGWRALDTVATWREMPGLPVSEMRTGDRLVTAAVMAAADGQLALAPALRFCTCILHRLASRDGAPDQQVYNLILDGDRSYVANGFVVHNKGEGGGGQGGGGDQDGNDQGDNDQGGGGHGGGGGQGGGSGGQGGGGGGESGGGGGESGGGESGGDPSNEGAPPSLVGDAPDDPAIGPAISTVVTSAGVTTPFPPEAPGPGLFSGNPTPVGPDLTLTEEELIIKNGWQ